MWKCTSFKENQVKIANSISAGTSGKCAMAWNPWYLESKFKLHLVSKGVPMLSSLCSQPLAPVLQCLLSSHSRLVKNTNSNSYLIHKAQVMFVSPSAPFERVLVFKLDTILYLIKLSMKIFGNQSNKDLILYQLCTQINIILERNTNKRTRSGENKKAHPGRR